MMTPHLRLDRPRPDRDLMHKILSREVTSINGNGKWIEPVLDYMEHIGSSDPRKAISFCLRGRDAWLDGSFRAKLESVRAIGSQLHPNA